MLDAGDDLQHEPHPAQEAAAEAVVPLVDVGAHELGDQVAVGPVQFDAVKARLLDAPRAFGEFLHQLVDLLNRHRADRFAFGHVLGVHDLVAGRAGDVDHLVAGRQQVFARPSGLAARVLDLHGALAPCRCMASASSAKPGISGSSSTHTQVTVGRPVTLSGDEAPTMISPQPPLAISSWYLITRSLTEPSALAELMSVGTWQTRLGTSKLPIRSGLNRWG